MNSSRYLGRQVLRNTIESKGDNYQTATISYNRVLNHLLLLSV